MSGGGSVVTADGAAAAVAAVGAQCVPPAVSSESGRLIRVFQEQEWCEVRLC